MVRPQKYLSLFFVLVLAACSDPAETVRKGKPCDECKIKNADFSGHKFTQKDLANIRFENSNFEGADFSNIRLTVVFFENNNLKGAIFDNAQFDKGAFEGSDLSNASFKDARMRYIFSGSSFVNADFSGARGRIIFRTGYDKYAKKTLNDLSGTNFKGARLSFFEMGYEGGKNIQSLKTVSNAEKIRNPEGLFYRGPKGSLPSGLEKTARCGWQIV